MTWSALPALTGALPAIAVIVTIGSFRRSDDPVARGGYLLIICLLVLVSVVTAAHFPHPDDFFSWLGGSLVLAPLFCLISKAALFYADSKANRRGDTRGEEPDELPFHPEPDYFQSISTIEPGDHGRTR